MGVKALIFLGLVVGALYCLHLLAQDYQAVTAASKIFRSLFKRDTISASNYTKPFVRWRQIFAYDQIQCARVFYCDLGLKVPEDEIRKNFLMMLSLPPREEDASAWREFQMAYNHGVHKNSLSSSCQSVYPACPLSSKLLFDVVQSLLKKYV